MTAPTKLILKKSSVAHKIPTASDLDHGELSINFADGIIYYKNSSNAIKNFRDLFNKLNIIKNLSENLEIWTYNSLNETARIAEKIKKELL